MTAPIIGEYWCSGCEMPTAFSWTHRIGALALFPITYGIALHAAGIDRPAIAWLYWRCWNWDGYTCLCKTRKHWTKKAVPHA